MAATIRNGESVRATRGGLLAGFSVRFCKNVAGRKAPSADELFLIVRAAGGAWVPSLVDAETAEEGDVPSDDVDDRRRPLIVVSSDPFSENLPKYFPRILIFFFDCLGGGGRRLSSETITIPTIPRVPRALAPSTTNNGNNTAPTMAVRSGGGQIGQNVRPVVGLRYVLQPTSSSSTPSLQGRRRRYFVSSLVISITNKISTLPN